MSRYGELEMQALLRRSVFALMYKEKCKWCENDSSNEILYGRASRSAEEIRKAFLRTAQAEYLECALTGAQADGIRISE